MLKKRKWTYVWIGLLAIQFLPIITTQNFRYDIVGNFMLAGNIIANNWLQYLDKFYLIFKIILLTFIVLFLFKKKITKLYLIYTGLMFLMFVVVQNVSYVEGYGYGFATPSIVPCIIMGILWLREAFKNKEEYVLRKKNPAFYLLIPLCIIAFWDPPVNHAIQGISMEFSLHNFLFSFSCMTECMTTCFFITIYLFTHEKYDSTAFRVMCMAEIIKGVENMILVIAYINSDRGAAIAWMITHFPQLIIAVTGYMLILIQDKRNKSYGD